MGRVITHNYKDSVLLNEAKYTHWRSSYNKGILLEAAEIALKMFTILYDVCNTAERDASALALH
jgi:hypothetical protein